MLGVRRIAAATAAVSSLLLAPSSNATAGETCDEEIYWAGMVPEHGPWWHLQYMCGEGHPQEGCYQAVGSSQYLAFDCSGSPSMPCNANGCLDTK